MDSARGGANEDPAENDRSLKPVAWEQELSMSGDPVRETVSAGARPSSPAASRSGFVRPPDVPPWHPEWDEPDGEDGPEGGVREPRRPRDDSPAGGIALEHPEA